MLFLCPQFEYRYIVIDVPNNSQYAIEMSFGIHAHRNHDDAEPSPKLVPTGSFDKVLLTGGKNLTLFQSIALIITGFGVALGAGVPIIVNETYLESQLGRYGYHRSLSSMIVGSMFILWGAAMLFNGLLGIARRIRKRHQG
jgi:hypothetical protein